MVQSANSQDVYILTIGTKPIALWGFGERHSLKPKGSAQGKAEEGPEKSPYRGAKEKEGRSKND